MLPQCLCGKQTQKRLWKGRKSSVNTERVQAQAVKGEVVRGCTCAGKQLVPLPEDHGRSTALSPWLM
jgi:hypothetical protein